MHSNIKLLQPTAPAIGLTTYEKFKTNTVPYHSGDLLLLYTDGVIEARNAQEDEFSEMRLKTFTEKHHAKNADEFLSQLKSEISNFAVNLHDDITILVIKFH
jgi:serine phosphatase RsbU (regulator of sigma subunit)